MAVNRRTQATRGGDKENRRDRERGVYLDPGPYIAKVINNVDNKRQGFITVTIPDLSSTDAETFDVRFASPFMSLTQNEGGEDNYAGSKQVAGIWIPQPDIGTEVIVMFPSGKLNKGIWFACIGDRFNYHSLPGNASSEFWNPDTDPNGEFRNPQTGEYNRYQAVGESHDPIRHGTVGYHDTPVNPLTKKKPINPYLSRIYKEQGLDNDNVRGHTTSSAQRETPSNVFGISTKGRPVYDIKDNAGVVTRLASNDIASLTAADKERYFKFKTRVQGHSFVMDDGDLRGDNQLVRLRSASGHQVLLHDSEGVIYIGNAEGTVWMEFGNDGKIDMFSQGSINVRSGTLNFHADSDVNMYAGGNISMIAGDTFQIEGATVNAKSKGNVGIEASAGGIGLKASNTFRASGSTVDITASGEVKIDGTCIDLGNGSSEAGSVPSLLLSSTADTTQIGSGFWTSIDGLIKQTVATRVPTHEPFERGTTTDTVSADDRSVEIAELLAAQELDKEVAMSAGVTQAKAKGLRSSERVSRGSVIAQPTPSSQTGSLDANQTRALLAAIGQRESNGNYAAVNQYGYLGKYQMGLAALEDIGYVRPGTYAAALEAGYDDTNVNDILNDPNVWTGKGGATNHSSFLTDADTQEEAMEEYTVRNVATLKRIGVLTDITPADQQAGLIMAAHLKGPGNVKKWVQNGGEFADANGTTIDDYYNTGRNAIASI